MATNNSINSPSAHGQLINIQTITAIGGNGGANVAAGTASLVTAGGAAQSNVTGSNATTLVNIGSQAGENGMLYSGNFVVGGGGGSSPLGDGGVQLIYPGTTNNVAGQAGTGYGAGAGGAINWDTNSGLNGGVGTQGIIIIYEYC